MFGAIGQIESAQIVTDRDTGRSKGFAFAQMADDTAAEKAIAQLNGRESPDVSLLSTKHGGEKRLRNRGGGGGSGRRRYSVRSNDSLPPFRLAVPEQVEQYRSGPAPADLADGPWKPLPKKRRAAVQA